jgi:hypothetical protein
MKYMLIMNSPRDGYLWMSKKSGMGSVSRRQDGVCDLHVVVARRSRSEDHSGTAVLSLHDDRAAHPRAGAAMDRTVVLIGP